LTIQQVDPRLEYVNSKHSPLSGFQGRRLWVRAQDGNQYPLLRIQIQSTQSSELKSYENSAQMLRLLEPCLTKRPESHRRLFKLDILNMVCVGPSVCIMVDLAKPLSAELLYRERMEEFENEKTKIPTEYDPTRSTNPVIEYHRRILTEGYQNVPKILSEFVEKYKTRNIMQNWSIQHFATIESKFRFQRIMTQQLALLNVISYVFGLRTLTPQKFFFNPETGFVSPRFYSYDISSQIVPDNPVLDTLPRLSPMFQAFVANIYGKLSHMAYQAQAASRALFYNRQLVEAVNRTCLKSEILHMIMQKRKLPAQINSSDDLIKVCGDLLTVDVNKKTIIDPEKFSNLLKKDDSAAIRKILSRIAGKQVERLGNLVVPLQTVEPTKVFENVLYRPSESFVEKSERRSDKSTGLDKNCKNGQSDKNETLEKVKVKLENVMIEDNQKDKQHDNRNDNRNDNQDNQNDNQNDNQASLGNHEINPWHILLEKASSFERLARLDPATKPWV